MNSELVRVRQPVNISFDIDGSLVPPRTVIGSDVWIGINSMIKSGVKIGHGSIIGMGSVVTKDVEPYTIVGGCPAKVIKKRFSDGIILELLQSKWWELKESDLKILAKHIKDPVIFLREFKKRIK